MKAFTLQKFGGAENLTLSDLPVPTIAPDEVLIQTKAISINPVDAFLRQHAEFIQPFMLPQPGQDTFILGWDVSGIVTEVGAAVTGFKKGDEVFGMVNFKGQGKTYADYVAAPAGQLAIKPANISHAEAAAASLAALTAYQSLVQVAKIKKGEKVLIHAAAGGVGHYAVQLARQAGAFVVANVSASKINFVKSLGADEVINYEADRFEEKITDADVVLDPIYGNHVLRSIAALKPGGRLISLMTFLNEDPIASAIISKNIQAHRHDVSSNGDDMQQIAALLASGTLKSHVSVSYDFNDLPQAHSTIEKGKNIGKIVVIL